MNWHWVLSVDAAFATFHFTFGHVKKSQARV